MTGTISNYSDIPCENVDMRFAVTSYVGSGADRGKAVVQPSTIPPGGTAAFSVHVSLGAEKPRNAIYTITADSPLVYGFDPAVAGEPIVMGDFIPPDQSHAEAIRAHAQFRRFQNAASIPLDWNLLYATMR